MARKDVIKTPLVIGQSLASSFSAAPTIVSFLDNCSYQINITTTDSSGTFSIEGSNDYQPANTNLPINPGTWVALPLSGATANPVAAGANDSILINLNQIPFSALRVSYSSSVAGTGTCDVYIMHKQIGG